MDSPPQYLYKILSKRDWEKTQSTKIVHLPTEDDTFIHLSTEEQLEKIIKKYWADVPQFVVVTVDTEQLSGRLVCEANPGGSNRYYHLYDGTIPFQSIISFKHVSKAT